MRIESEGLFIDLEREPGKREVIVQVWTLNPVTGAWIYRDARIDAARLREWLTPSTEKQHGQ